MASLCFLVAAVQVLGGHFWLDRPDDANLPRGHGCHTLGKCGQTHVRAAASKSKLISSIGSLSGVSVQTHAPVFWRRNLTTTPKFTSTSSTSRAYSPISIYRLNSSYSTLISTTWVRNDAWIGIRETCGKTTSHMLRLQPSEQAWRNKFAGKLVLQQAKSEAEDHERTFKLFGSKPLEVSHRKTI